MSDPRNTPLPALIVYSSRTGRTEGAARQLKVHLDARNYETDLFKVGSGEPPDLARYRLLVFGAADVGLPPLLPKPDPRLMGFIASLPALDGRKAAVFTVEPHDIGRRGAAPAIEKALIDKGADVVARDRYLPFDKGEVMADLAAECMIRAYR